ncbi:hypothetical protein GCM10009830_16240 [Glycomyces endophyticus]|uniref:Uncharacterized protein n=1 Tax=Glycomyces endophyticus TaxID=480996 RepID=A0ABN2GGS3_9ACTN
MLSANDLYDARTPPNISAVTGVTGRSEARRRRPGPEEIFRKRPTCDDALLD